jgi:IS30 family transposase
MARRKDSVPQEQVDRIMRLHRDQLSSHEIADQLNRWHIPTARGGRWHSSTVAGIVRRGRSQP